MIIVFETQATESQVRRVEEAVGKAGLSAQRSDGVEHTVLGILGDIGRIDKDQFKLFPGVKNVLRVSSPYKLASRAFHPEKTIVNVGDVAIGGPEVIVFAGPCSVESETQIDAAAAAVAASGARILRGGAFKPRTSPYSFQGLGEDGLKMIRAAADAHGLKVATEVMAIPQIEVVAKYADMLQVGTRNMQNFALLTELGGVGKPVLLKRGYAATIEDWLMSAEYILSAGNPNVVLCERGIRTFEPFTRNTMDISSIPVVQHLSHLPVIGDPSHAVGDRRFVAAMARAAVAAGADGIMVEVHPDPDAAYSDGPQSLVPEAFTRLMNRCRIIATTLGRRIAKGAGDA